MPPPRVLLVCSGLDHAHRGFETFARECFDALRDDPGVRIELIKGSGERGLGERSLPTPTRENRLVRGVASIVGTQAFRLEAFAFGLELVPVVLKRQPDVVYTSEWDTARVLARLRDRSPRRFKVLLSNGSFASTGFEHLDHVQELTPGALEYVVKRGAEPAQHTVLPLGFHITPQLVAATSEQRDALRRRLGLPIRRKIVISVAAVNSHHKRIDYVIDELAAIPEPRPFLLLVGQPEPETTGLLDLARRRLGEGNFDFRTVPAREVPGLLRSSDLFVLASLREMQGRSLIEAAANGVECIAHDNPVMRFALGEHGIYGDLHREGELARLLSAHPSGGCGAAAERRLAVHHHVYERFSWDRLRPDYVKLLTMLAGDGVAGRPEAAQRERVTSAHEESTTRAPWARRAMGAIRRHSSGSDDSVT